MQTESTQLSASDLCRSVVRRAVPSFIVLLFQLIGGWRFNKDMFHSSYAMPLSFFYQLVWLVLAFSSIGPIVVLDGFKIILVNRSAFRGHKQWLAGLLLLLTVSLILSLFSFVWSCGGHPTWMDGYR